MPETLTPPAPAAPSAAKSPIPSSAPAAAPAPESPPPAAEAPKPKVGMNDFISKLGKPAEAPKTDVSTKPSEGTAPDAVKPQEHDDSTIGDDVWEKAPKNLKNAYYKTRRELEGKLTSTEAKIKELEGKPNQSPADLKKIQELEARSTRLENDLKDREDRLVQADYQSSKDFNEKYGQKGTRAYQRAVEEVKQLMVKTVDAEGNETQRQATANDFDEVRDMKPYQQDKALNEMFGTSAFRVAGHLRAIENIESEAREAISNARTKSDEARRDNERKQGEFKTEFEGHYQRETDALSKHETGFFAPIADNPEASAALENGYKWVDETLANVSKMNPKEAAEAKATLRALAAYAPRGMTENRQLKDENASLKEELSRYRKSSPGSAAPSVSSAPLKEQARGIDAAINEMLEKGKR